MNVEYPHAPDVPKGRHGAVPIGSGTHDLVRVHTWQQCTMLPSLSVSCLLYGNAAQEVCTYSGR